MFAQKLRNRIIRLLSSQPKTRVASTSTSPDFYSERRRSVALLRKYGVIYDQGGIVTEAINMYPMFLDTNGYHFEGDPGAVKIVEDLFDQLDFEELLWESVTDALIYGDAFQEIITGGNGDILQLIPRAAYSFEIHNNLHAKPKGYTQHVTINGIDKDINLKPASIFHLRLWKAKTSEYGLSMIHRAYDEILSDTRIYEATTTSIYRHGFKKYHVRVGLEGENVPDTMLKNIDKDFQDLEAKNDFVTQHDIEILPIDEGGLENIHTYNDISILRLAGALGVPEELIGLNRSSTNATATKRIETFFKKIGTLQKQVARAYTRQIIDRMVPPGTVRLVFNDVSPDDEGVKAKWITQVMSASGEDPFIVLPREWVQEQFGITPDGGE